MTYALVLDGQIQSVGPLPRGASRLSDRAWLQPLDPADAASCGYLEVVDVERPADTAQVTHDRSVELVDGTPTVVWTQRAWTPEELTARTEAANGSTIRTQAETVLTANRTFLGLASPTNAQTLAQVRALTRQMNGLIRLTIGHLDGTD